MFVPNLAIDLEAILESCDNEVDKPYAPINSIIPLSNTLDILSALVNELDIIYWLITISIKALPLINRYKDLPNLVLVKLTNKLN